MWFSVSRAVLAADRRSFHSALSSNLSHYRHRFVELAQHGDRQGSMPSLLLMVSCQLELFCHSAHAELLCSLCSLEEEEEEEEEVAGALLVVGCCFACWKGPRESQRCWLCWRLCCWLCWRLCCWLCWCCWLLLLSSLPPSCFASSCPPWRSSRGAALALEVCFFRALQPAKE